MVVVVALGWWLRQYDVTVLVVNGSGSNSDNDGSDNVKNIMVVI